MRRAAPPSKQRRRRAGSALAVGLTAYALLTSGVAAEEPGDGASTQTPSSAATAETSSALARATTLAVRAGEHDGFSRLVVKRPRGAEWRVTPTEEGVDIRFEGAGFNFDETDVLTRRQAHRVATMETIVEDGATTLRFGFNCDCAVETKTLGGRNLMLDIAPKSADAPPSAGASKAASAASDEPVGETPVDEPIESASTSAEQVARAQQALLAQLQRAAEQGLISFKEGAAPAASPQAPSSDQPDQLASPTEPTPPSPAATDAPAINLGPLSVGADAEQAADESRDQTAQDEASTGVDAAAQNAARALEETIVNGPAPGEPTGAPLRSPLADAIEPVTADEPHACLPNAMLAAHDWRAPGPFYDALSQHRRALYDALYNVDAAVVAEIARLYIAHGLPEEALSTPRSFDVSTDETSLTDALARVLMGQPPQPGDAFARLEPCPGLHGVWQAAALSEIDPAAAIEAFRGARRSLTAFGPPHRRYLGARVARAALAIGEEGLATEILEVLRRDSSPPPPEMIWAEIEYELEHGSMRRGRRLLNQLATTRTGDAPVAAATLADSLGAESEIAEVARVTAVLDDFVMQYRGSETGARVAEAQAALVARFGDLTAAAHLLDRAAYDSPDFADRLAAKRTRLVEADIAAAIAEPSPERLSAALQAANLLEDDRGDTIRIALAETLVAHGAHALAPLALPAAVAARSATARTILADAEAAAALEPARFGVDQSEERPIDILRRTKPPEIQRDEPVRSGRAILDVVDEELELLKEIAKQ